MNVSIYKDALLKKRAELEETAGLKPLTDSMEHNNGRQGDMADQASGQQRSPHPAETEADRRQDPAGDRRSADAHRKGHLRRLPRLRRADRRGAAERHSLDPRLHHLQGKAESVSDPDPRRADPRRSISSASPADAPRGRRRSSSPTTTSTTPTSTSSPAKRRTCRGCSTRCSTSARRSSADPPRGPRAVGEGRCVEGAGRRGCDGQRAVRREVAAAGRGRDATRATRAC